MSSKRKPIEEREEAYKHLPERVRESFTDEEKEAFLYEEVCPDSIFGKLQEFSVVE